MDSRACIPSWVSLGANAHALSTTLNTPPRRLNETDAFQTADQECLLSKQRDRNVVDARTVLVPLLFDLHELGKNVGGVGGARN